MPATLREKAIAQYRRDGVLSVLRSGSDLVKPDIPSQYYIQKTNEPFVLTGDDVYSHAERLLTIRPSTSLTISYGGTNEEGIAPGIERATGSSESADRVICEFADADVIGSPAGVRRDDTGAPSLIRVDGKYIVPEAIGPLLDQHYKSCRRFNTIYGKRRAIQHRLWPADPDRQLDSVFLLTTPYGAAFGKLYLDLCKLQVFEEYRRRTGTQPSLLIPAEMTDWLRDALSLMGYPPDSYIELDSETIRADTLVVPSYRARHDGGECQPRPQELRWVRNRILDALPEDFEPSRKRLYISRQDVDRRNVRNHEAVVDILSSYGFEVIVPSELSYHEQAQLFANADVIVGPHGSGLSNIILSSNATLVELQSRNRVLKSSFFIMTNEIGLEYECVPCDRGQTPEDCIVSRRHRDLIVDTGVLKKVLESVCNEEQ